MQLILYIFAATLVGLVSAPAGRIAFHAWMPAAALVALLLVFRYRRTFFLPFCCCVLFFLLANVQYHQAVTPAEVVTRIDGVNRKLIVSGSVETVVPLTDGRARIDVVITTVHDKDHPLPASSGLKVRLYIEKNSRRLLPGDRIRFTSKLRKPRLFQTPGEFNWPRYLASQGVSLTGWVKSDDLIEVQGRLDRLLTRPLAKWRFTVAELLKETLPEQRSDLVRALVLGQGRVLDRDVRKSLSESGISHLFAISGLHFGLIALFGYQLFLRLSRHSALLLEWAPPQRFIPLVLLPLLFAYLILTGDAVSTRRAFALAVCAGAFLLWRYYVNPLMLLASLALLALLVNPLMLWQAGWQLSFAGAAGILMWKPFWQHPLVRAGRLWWRYPVQLFLVTGAATLATFPLVLMNFHMAAPAAVVVNLVAVPAVTLLALPLGLLGLTLVALSDSCAFYCFNFCGQLLEALIAFSQWIVQLDGLGGHYQFLSNRQYAAVGIVALFFLFLPRMRMIRLHLFPTTAGVCLALVLWLLPAPPVENVALTLFSVGQGESLLLRNRQGQAVLIDGGGLYSDRFDVGERLLAPALGEMRVKRLDAVVLTHDHPDHRKGLIFILENFPVERFYSAHRLDELHPSLRRVLQRRSIPYLIFERGWSRMAFWQQGELMAYNSANPDFSENDSSVALYMQTAPKEGFLLTGDLEKAGVNDLLEARIPGPVSVLKLPHHGSRHSNTDRLVELLQPDLCLVSAGYRNRYRLPAKEVVGLLEQKSIPLYRTDITGTIHVRAVNDEMHVR